MATLIKGRYEILETLGAGGEARVVKALDLQHGRVVALKIRPVPDGETREHALNEARILLAIPPHPGASPGARGLLRGRGLRGRDGLGGRDRPGEAAARIAAGPAWRRPACWPICQMPPRRLRTCTRRRRRSSTVTSSPGTSSSPRVAASSSWTSGCPRRPMCCVAAAARPVTARPSSPPAGRHRAPVTSTPSPRPRSPCSPAPRPPERCPRGRASTRYRPTSCRRPSGWAWPPTPTGVRRPPGSWSSGCARAGRRRCPPAWSRSACRTSRARPPCGRPSRRRWREALVRHDELIADCMAAYGGRLIESKGEGDSTVSVFRLRA